MPPSKMQQRFPPLCRARRIHATVRDHFLVPMDRAATFRTSPRHLERLTVLAGLHDLQYVRHHFPRAFDQHRIANLQSHPLDFVHIVERVTAHTHPPHSHPPPPLTPPP